MTDGVTIALVSGISAIVSAAVTVGLPWLLEKQRKKRMDLSDGMEDEDRVHGILEDLRFTLDADRVTLWYGSNGDTTFALHHLKKMSVTGESNRAGLDGMKEECQLMPIAIFERMLRSLRAITDGTVVQSDEASKKDTLANFNKKYGMNQVCFCKVLGKWNNWAGILVVSWRQERSIVGTQFFEINLAAKKISG